MSQQLNSTGIMEIIPKADWQMTHMVENHFVKIHKADWKVRGKSSKLPMEFWYNTYDVNFWTPRGWGVGEWG
jgi:hypothetical protein